jgi:hypothetical protein
MRSIKWLASSLVLCSIALSTGGDAGAAVSGPKTGVVCLDNTGLAASDLLAAKQVLATSIKALPAPGSPAATIYVRAVTDHSYGSGALATIVLPPVAPLPAATTCDIFDVSCKNANKRRRAIALAQLKTASSVAAQQAAHLLALPVPRSRTKPDLAGCLTKASQIYPRRGAQYLVLVSNLSASPDSVGALRLPGVDVDVLFVCQGDTATCLRRREGWIRAFQRMGAIDGVFWDLSQRPTLFAGS